MVAARSSLFRFLLVGFVNTAAGLGTMWIVVTVAGANDVVANVAGYTVGLTVSFTLNRRWSFTFQGDGRRALLRFLLVFGVAYAANLGAVLWLIHRTRLDPFVCQMVGTVPYTTLFYLGCRYFAFRTPRKP